MASPTVVMSERRKRGQHLGLGESGAVSGSGSVGRGEGSEFSFSSPTAKRGGGQANADILQSVQRELLLLRHHLSPPKDQQQARGRRNLSPRPKGSPQGPAVLFGSVMEHNSKEQKIVLQPRLPEAFDPDKYIPADEVKQFVGNVATLITSTDPSLSLGKDLKKKLRKVESLETCSTEDVVSSMHETVLAVRELCRIFCKQRIQLAEMVTKRTHVDHVLEAATHLSQDGMMQDLARERERSAQLERELLQAQGKQLELEGELQLLSCGMGGAGVDAKAAANAAGSVDSSSHPRVTLETLLEAQASQSKQLTEVLEAVRTNQQDISLLKTQSTQSARAARRNRVLSGTAPDVGPSSSSRRSSKIEKLRKAALSTDSEQESFDNDDSEEEEQEQGKGAEAGPSEEADQAIQGLTEGTRSFMDVVQAARGANSTSSWGKLKGKMPMIRRRHGIHQSISLKPPSKGDSISRASLRGGLNLFGDSDENNSDAADAKQNKLRQVPRHMIQMTD
ncbi:hypothetical protein A3770_04p29600 [Chloropicon primus]|uniref:Uncharacterized protein n=1 Tax=Chloropicon primus TaxID=1764295 RepID=A0A5B8MM57_9CHLO|nr:hypothetical protein A3770_04p29600 [Chloropicon primus]|eukprot:QDZ20442.1 hypothetical protein A3770_04p29600 [Chloropicon primus]